MDVRTLVAVSVLILAFGLLSKRLQRSPITPAMVFVGFGFLMGPAGLGVLHLGEGGAFIEIFAELTLVVVLFTDAARIDLAALRRDYHIPLRLLGIGMPLTIALGTVAALALFTGFGLFEAALLAAILAPTDAALGQAIVSSPHVPARIRQALNVESGLNDGLALPAVMILAACAEAAQGQAWAGWIGYAAKQIGLGPLVGVVVAFLGGRALQRAARSGWMSHSFQELAGLALALLAFGAATAIGGNGFVAAFVAGLTIGNTARSACSALYDFTETEGQLLVLLTFSLFGALSVGSVLHTGTWDMVLYGALSLTLLRMLPVALSLAGMGLRAWTRALLGWFGPRGLASILFGFLIVERAQIAHRDEIFSIAIVTVLLSVVVHGVTAYPASKAYGDYCSRDMEGAPEHVPVTEMPVRVSHPSG